MKEENMERKKKKRWKCSKEMKGDITESEIKRQWSYRRKADCKCWHCLSSRDYICSQKNFEKMKFMDIKVVAT